MDDNKLKKTQRKFSDSFKQEAVEQVMVHGYSILEAAEKLDISDKTLYSWVKKQKHTNKTHVTKEQLLAEVHNLKTELKRVNREKDILREAALIMAKTTKLY